MSHPLCLGESAYYANKDISVVSTGFIRLIYSFSTTVFAL